MYHGSCTDKVNTFTSIDFYSIFYRRINQTLKSGPDYNRPVAGVSSLVGHPAGDAYFWLGQGCVTEAGAGEHNALS